MEQLHPHHCMLQLASESRPHNNGHSNIWNAAPPCTMLRRTALRTAAANGHKLWPTTIWLYHRIVVSRSTASAQRVHCCGKIDCGGAEASSLTEVSNGGAKASSLTLVFLKFHASFLNFQASSFVSSFLSPCMVWTNEVHLENAIQSCSKFVQ